MKSFFIIIALVFGAFEFIYPTESAKVVINEVRLINPKRPGSTDFIELKQTAGKGNEMPLRGYKLIGFSCKATTGTIDTVATFWNSRMHYNGFFTIGGSEISTADIKIPNVMVKFQSSFSKGRNTLTSFLTNVNPEMRAIALLYDEKNSFGDISLTEKDNLLPISETIINTLKQYLVDLVVFAGNVPCDKSDLIEKIYSDFGQRKYVLREVKFNVADDEISLNRCTIANDGFLPEMFKLGNPTPGAENDCNGPHYILEDNIEEAISSEDIHYSLNENDYELDKNCASRSQSQAQAECSSSIPQSDYVQTSSFSIQNSINQLNISSNSNACTGLLLSPDADENASILEQENRRKRNIGVDTDHSEEYEWLTTKYFQ